MRISDWSSDVCSSDLSGNRSAARAGKLGAAKSQRQESWAASGCSPRSRDVCQANGAGAPDYGCARRDRLQHAERQQMPQGRSEEHTSELQSLMRISYAVFCLKKKNTIHCTEYTLIHTLPYNYKPEQSKRI